MGDGGSEEARMPQFRSRNMGSNMGSTHAARRVLALACAAVALAARVRAEPVQLKTTEMGHGPTIVFVHALGGSRSDWLPIARKLLGRYRVVLVDLPGHGESPLPDPFSFASVGD